MAAIGYWRTRLSSHTSERRPPSAGRVLRSLSAMITDDKVAAMVKLLEPLGLDALYVYGSEAASRTGPKSDVDLAALTERVPGGMELMDLRARLEAAVGRDVDLVFLGQASPIVAWQVLRHGKLVYESNSRRRAQLEIRTITAYADLKRSRAPVERALIDRMGRDS